MTQVEEKPSLEELAHHGVSGMKWGHRNGSTAKEAKPKKVKVTTADIKAARSRQEANLNKMDRAVDNNVLAKSAKGKAATQKIIDKHYDAILKDEKVANKSTRGEKVTLVVLGLMGAAVVASTMSSASSNAQSGKRNYY